MNSYSESITNFLGYLQFRIDTTKYLLDKPYLDYQPLPWIGIKTAGVRGKATVNRWKTIRKFLLKSDKTLKDIGSCVGYFCISCALEYDMLTLGVDMNDKFLRISRFATPKKLNNRCNFINLVVNEESASFLPRTDITLCLSIWHHWVFNYGLVAATKILIQLWNSSNRILFFESGEEEVREEFALPYPTHQKASEWLYDYLKTNLNGSKVEHVGKFLAGDYPHYVIKNNKRTLFKITRLK